MGLLRRFASRNDWEEGLRFLTPWSSSCGTPAQQNGGQAGQARQGGLVVRGPMGVWVSGKVPIYES